jgi:hypothetical protein
MEPVTMMVMDTQAAQWCDECGATPTFITVIRWTAPIPEQTGRVAQQSHYFCHHHWQDAKRMRQQLWNMNA